MTSLFGPRRRAEEFARADEAMSGDGALRGDGAAGLDRETTTLLQLAASLRSMSAADDLAMPGEAFSLDLRERLVTEAATVLVAQRVETGSRTVAAADDPTTRGSTPRGWARGRRRFATATATVAILMGGTAGMASAAQESLPGQALYPVKRGLEKAAVTFSGSPVDRGRELLTQASGRLDEVQGLMDAGAAERTQIPGTLDTFNEQAREGAELLMSSYESTDDETAMVTLRNFTASSMDTIEDLASEAPDQALTGLDDAAVLMQEVDTAADEVCPGCSDLPALPASDVLSLTNAGAIGFPGDGTSPAGGLFGGTTGELGAVSGDPLAPLLPGLPAGQNILGVPGAPAPTGTDGSAAETPETTNTDPGEAPADGEVPEGSDPGVDPGTEGPLTDGPGTGGPSTDDPGPADPGTDPVPAPTPNPPPTPAEPSTPPEPSAPAEPSTPPEPSAPAEPSTPPEPSAPAEPSTPPEPSTPAEPSTPTDATPTPDPPTAPVEDPGAEQPAGEGDQSAEPSPTHDGGTATPDPA